MRNYDEFDVVPPGSVEEMACPTCGEKMSVERNVKVTGGRGWAGMGRPAVTFDHFSCEFRKEGWHQQAVDLTYESTRTHSNTLRLLFLDEAKTIVASRQPTLEWYND